MKRYSFSLDKLCTPSILYFIISIFILIIIGLNNLNQSDKLCLGVIECNVGNNVFIFLLNALYILFWTFILDLMCKNGWSDLSWFIFLLPFILVILFYSFIIFTYI
jgi:hypothetical protein